MAKKNLIRPLIFIIIISAIFLPSFIKYQELRWRNKNLERQIRVLKEETKALDEEKRKLETDITYVEKKAREKIGVVKKGEIILREAPAKK